MSIKFDFLEHGDCTIVTTDEFTMMIDGGYSHPFEAFEFEGPIPTIDSVVVTHIDRDHIGGVIDCFQDEAIVKNLKHVVFNEPESFAEFVSPSNTTEVNIDDGNLLSTVIKANPNIKPWSWICTKTKRLDRSITGSTRQTKFTVLSPPEHLLQKLFDKWDKNLFKEDTSIFGKADDFRSVTELINTKENYNDNSSTPNGSSLAFLIEHKNNKFMILGDAYVTQILTKKSNTRRSILN